MFSGLDTESYDRSYTDRQLVRRVGDLFRARPKTLAVVVVLIIALAVVTAVQPLVVAEGINLLGQNPAPAVLIALVAISLAIGLFILGRQLAAAPAAAANHRHGHVRPARRCLRGGHEP